MTTDAPVYVAVIAGRRRAVHRLSTDPKRTGRCHVDETDDGEPVLVGAGAFASIATNSPNRLCGHCYPVVDR